MKIYLKVFVCFICFASINNADLTEDFYKYSMEIDHPLHEVLDRIFVSSKTLESEKNLIKAGFVIIQSRIPSFIVAKHSALPGYLVKLHLHSSDRSIESRWKNFVARCNGAERLRNLIRKEKIKYFTVPDKWIYTTPTESQDPILIVTRMNIVSDKETKYAWKNLATSKHIKELYKIIKNKCGSSKLIENIPYTKEGVFTCIDTEKPSQGDKYLKKYLSPEMQDYWEQLVREDKNR